MVAALGLSVEFTVYDGLLVPSALNLIEMDGSYPWGRKQVWAMKASKGKFLELARKSQLIRTRLSHPQNSPNCLPQSAQWLAFPPWRERPLVSEYTSPTRANEGWTNLCDLGLLAQPPEYCFLP